MLRTRVISAAIGLPIVLGAIFIGGNVLISLVFLLTIQSLYEFYNAFKNIDYRPSAWIGYVGTIIYYCLILLDFESFGILISVLFVMIILLFFEILRKDKDIIDFLNSFEQNNHSSIIRKAIRLLMTTQEKNTLNNKTSNIITKELQKEIKQMVKKEINSYLKTLKRKED